MFIKVHNVIIIFIILSALFILKNATNKKELKELKRVKFGVKILRPINFKF